MVYDGDFDVSEKHTSVLYHSMKQMPWWFNIQIHGMWNETKADPLYSSLTKYSSCCIWIDFHKNNEALPANVEFLNILKLHYWNTSN